MPGLVDTHVHLNEPGRTSSEGFYTGTQAAASGGVTTLIDMPLNSIPATTSVVNLQIKMKAAQGKCWVDVGFLGGIVPDNIHELKPMIQAGIRGFKGFMIDSGVPEFPLVKPVHIRAAMDELADEPTMLMFHAEMLPDPDEAEALPEGENAPFIYPNPATAQSRVYSEFLASRPPMFETKAVGELISLASQAPSPPIHVAHVSSAEVIPMLSNAQQQGINISAETCFHYLSLAAEDVPLRDTRFKAEPPIRSRSNKDALWASLLSHQDQSQRQLQPQLQRPTMTFSSDPEKTALSPPQPSRSALTSQPISMVVSDHSPCAPSAKLLPSYIPPHAEPAKYHDDIILRKNGDFFRAWGGISSLGFGLSILWTQLSLPTDNTSPLPLTTRLLQLASWLSSSPARLVGLERLKGSLTTGLDGDILIFDPDVFWTVESVDMRFRHKMSPYQGKTLKGRVCQTWLRGKMVFELGADDGFGPAGPQGKLIVEPRRKRDDEGHGDVVVKVENSRDTSVDESVARSWAGVLTGCLGGSGAIRL